MMTPGQIAEAAETLFQAEATGRQCGLLSLQYPGMTLGEAYAVQAALVARKQERGARRIGWKIGLTSRAMQSALNIGASCSMTCSLPMARPFRRAGSSSHGSRPRSPS